MVKLTPEQAALTRDDLDQLHGEGRWAGDTSNWCLHDGHFASNIVARYNCGSMSQLIDAVDDAYQGRTPRYCSCGRPALPGWLLCPRHVAEQQIAAQQAAVELERAESDATRLLALDSARTVEDLKAWIREYVL